MKITCKNCQAVFEGHFCSNCGQSGEIQRLSFRFLWREFQHGFVFLDSGILYTLKQLFTRPGHSIREFVEGKRVRHIKPVSLVLILATTYGFLYHYFHINPIMGVDDGLVAEEKALLEMLSDWIMSHFAFVTLVSIPLFSVGSYLAFKNQSFNFAEHMVLNVFLAAQRLFLHIAVFPIDYFLQGSPKWEIFSSLSDFTDFGLLVWGYTQFFNRISWPKAFFRTVISLTIFFILLISVGVLIVYIIQP